MSKSDTSHFSKNRVFLGREAWIQHIKDYHSSGLTQPEYAKKHGLVLATFRNWIHRLLREAQEESVIQEKPAFLPVKLNLREVNAMDLESGLTQDIAITLPNGIKCRFTTRHQPSLILPWIEYLRVLP